MVWVIGDRILFKQSNKISRIGLINMSPVGVYLKRKVYRDQRGGKKGKVNQKTSRQELSNVLTFMQLGKGSNTIPVGGIGGVPSPPQQTVFEGLPSKESLPSFIVQMYQMIQIVDGGLAFCPK